MNDAGEPLSGIYRYTSIARPVDPAYPTNRALLLLLPLVAFASAGIVALADLPNGIVSSAVAATLACFVAWALTRELAPDDHSAAFVAFALSFPASLLTTEGSVLLPFVALFLVRVVNRSTGLAARPFDTLMVIGLSIWAAIALEQPLILLIVAAAFCTDALLRDPLRRHVIAAAVCLGAFAWRWYDTGLPAWQELAPRDWALLALIGVATFLVASDPAPPASACDVSPEKLDATRIRAGLLLALLLAFQALLTEGASAWLTTPIWICLAAVPMSRIGNWLVRVMRQA